MNTNPPTTEHEPEDPDMSREQAWGHVKPTAHDAIDDANTEMGKLAAGMRREQVGPTRTDEVRKTPTGHQARVSANLRTRRKDAE